MEELYVKEGRRYKKIGTRWEGFPADGIWLVWDGTQNCLVKLEDISSLPNRDPWDLTTLMSYRSVISDVILEYNGKTISAWDLAEEIVGAIIKEKERREKICYHS